nr:uncharacterized protein LOC107430971 isoform X3 [Ziziphus jujuba var. spinosa]
MAAEKQYPPEENQEEEDREAEKAAKEEEIVEEVKKVMCSYLGVSFCVFLALAPRNWRELQRQVRELTSRLWQAEEQVKQMRSRRKEDSKANARVVEIFASHRNKWQEEEKRLLNQIDEANQEVAHLNARIADFEKAEADSRVRILHLERELAERDEMIGFMSRTGGDGGGGSEFEEHSGGGGFQTEWYASGGGVKEDYGGGLETERELEDLSVLYEQHLQLQSQHSNGFDSELFSSASKLWAERASVWQDVQYESLESMYNRKHFVARESPWKVDGESTGVSSKLKVLEEELLNLEKVGKTDISKVPSLMRKQAKRYQALAGKIDDLCRRMVILTQASDPCEPTLTTEFRTQRQTEFLLEAFRLQQRASETGQKLMALQTEIGKSYHGDELGSQAKLTTKRSLDSIRNNFKEIQRNLEIWLARIIGDLEGILARDGASRVREYYISRNPFVQ